MKNHRVPLGILFVLKLKGDERSEMDECGE